MEVHRYSILVVILFILASVFLQSKLPLWWSPISRLDLPLIVTIYFGLVHRDPIRGLAIGMSAGLLQDGLSPGPLGRSGLTKTVVGFLASSISRRVDVDQWLPRVVALLVFSVVNLALFGLLDKLFLTPRFSWSSYHFVTTPLLNLVIGVPVFTLGDRFRKRD